jgi:hypothetical protein
VSLVVVPPHADFTLEWPAPEGGEVVDVARAFVQEALTPATLRRRAGELERQEPSAETARAMLLLRAAAELLEVAGGDAHRHLRACGAGLTGLSQIAAPMRLRLDDVALPGGTTERSRDLPGDFESLEALFGQGLGQVPRRCSGSTGRVRLRLDRDQQVPAVVALIRKLGSRPGIEVTGAFAARHWAALSRLPGFAEVSLHVDEERAPRIAGSPLLPRAEPGLSWVDDPYCLRIPRERPWAGVVPFGAVAEPRALIDSGCRVLVLTFCALGDEAVGADGVVLSEGQLGAAVEALRAAGVRLVGEWWIGAPGVGEDALERTLQIIEQAPPFGWLAGVRPFHWPAHRGAGPWGRVHVTPGPVPEGRDLARSRPFEAPGTLSPAAAAERLQALAGRLARQGSPSPGRLAQAYVSSPPPLPERGERIRLDPDCALVTLPVSLEGRPGPSTYAVNLRTGLLLALDARVAPALQGVRAPTPPAEVLSRLSEAQRGKLVRALVDKAVLIEVR